MLVLTDATDEALAVRSQTVDDLLEVVHLERHVAQPQFVGHRGGDPGSWLGPAEPRQLQLRRVTFVGWPQHDDLGTGVGYAGDGVQKLALHGHPGALDLETQPDEERRHRVEVRDRDSHVVESLNA